MRIRRWVVKRNLFKRRATWFISTNLIHAAYEWKKPKTSKQASILYKLMTTDLFCVKDLIGKALLIFNVVLGSGKEGKHLSELTININYERSRSDFSVNTVSLILLSWADLGWLSQVRTNGQSDRWILSSKLVQVARQYTNRSGLRTQLFDLEMKGEVL